MKVRGRHDHDRRRAVVPTVVGLGCGLACAVLLPATPAGAGDRAPDPMLSISVDNGRGSAEVGDTLDYTITVDNVGPDPVKGLRVTQTMPAGLTLESADAGGSSRQGMVVWSVDVAPERSRVLHTSMTVGATSDDLLRLASVACASVSAKQAPLVCATHSDELPAGQVARQEANQASEAAETAPASDGSVAARLGLTSGAAVIVIAAAAVILRRRRSRPVA